MKTVYAAILATLLTMPLLARGQMPKENSNKKAVQQIVEFRNRYVEAEENKDIAYLNKILAKGFFALNPQGQLLGKAQQIENLRRTDRVFHVLNPRETRVHFYDNGNVAILTERVTVDGEDKGRHFGGEFRFVRIFVKQHGNWQVASAVGVPLSTQLTKVK